MHILKSVGVLSAAKVVGMLYGAMGLIFIPVALLMMSFRSLVGESTPIEGGYFFLLSIVLPLVNGVMGFFIGALGAIIYNVVAAWVGGLEMRMEIEPAGPESRALSHSPAPV